MPNERKSWTTAAPNTHDFDRARFDFISHLMNGLLNYYDVVIHNDVDELFIVDPEISPDLLSFIARNQDFNVMAGLGFEITHDYRNEASFTRSSHLFAQRHWGVFRLHHSKPHIISRHTRIGGHGCNKSFHLFEGLYLFHMKYIDQNYLMERQKKLYEFYKGGIGGSMSRWRLSPEDICKELDQMLAAPERSWGPNLPDLCSRTAVMKPNHWVYEIVHALTVEERQAVQTHKVRIPERFRNIAFL